MDIDVTSRSGAGDFNTSFSGGDILEALNFAAMGAGEVHYGRAGVLFDLVYANLSGDGTTTGPFSSSVKVKEKMLLATMALGYKVYEENGYLIEPFAGARYVDMETTVNVTGGGPIEINAGASVALDWWDPIVGVRGAVPLTDSLTLAGFTDIGGFGAGSEFTWEMYAGLDYAVSENFSAVAGFRYISIDYEASAAEANLETYGPLLGATMRF